MNSGGSTDTSSTLNDLAGSSGVSDPTGGGDLGAFFSNLGQIFTGGSNATSSPAAAVNAVTQATDPTGTIAAQTAITGGQQAPAQSQNQSPQGGDSQGGQQGQDQQFAPPAAVNALKEALKGLTQQQRQNPYGFPTNVGNAAAGQNSPMLNRAGRIPTGQVPPAPANPANIPAGDAQEVSMVDMGEGASNQPEYGDYKNPRQYPYEYEGESNQPEYGPGRTANPYPEGESNQPEYGPGRAPFRIPGPSGPTGSGQLVPRGNTLPATVPQDTGGNTLGGLAGLARALGIGVPAAGAAAILPFTSTPAETGEAPTNAWFQRPSGVPDPQGQQQQPLPSDPAQPATKDEYEQWLKNQGVPPKEAKKKADASPLPTKKDDKNLPTKKEPPPQVDQDGHGPIMRDTRGVSTGAPLPLGQIAQFALPLMMLAMSGGFGGGGRRGDRIGGRWGHPGGFGGRNHFHGGGGHWPYHHPQFGWAAHGGHPGGGWKPMHPNDFRQFRRDHGQTFGHDGNMPGDNPAIQAIMLQAAMGGGQRQQEQQGQRPGQSGFGRPQGGNLGYTPPQTQGPWSANPFLTTVVGAESSGQNSGAPGQGPGGDGGIARGYYNIQTPTWRDFSKNVPGADQYATADMAPPEVQTQVAMTIPAARFGDRTRAILHQQFGNFDERMTLGQLADQYGGEAWANRGKTTTGAPKTANPDGNPPATTQLGPEAAGAAA